MILIILLLPTKTDLTLSDFTLELHPSRVTLALHSQDVLYVGKRSYFLPLLDFIWKEKGPRRTLKVAILFDSKNAELGSLGWLSHLTTNPIIKKFS